MKKLVVVLILLIAFSVTAQNKYGLKTTSLSEYKASIQANPDKPLIDLKKLIPVIVLNFRNPPKNNFTKKKINNLSKPYPRKRVAEPLKKAKTNSKTRE